MNLILSMTLLLSALAAKAENCAQLVSTMGNVDILRLNENANKEDDRTTAKYKTPTDLLCTDVIVTHQGSRAKIKLPLTVMTLSPNSRVFVSQISGKKNGTSVINLTYGKMRSFFKGEKKSDGSVGLRVKTPNAVAGVRGTDFYMSYDPNTQITEQATLNGKVEVEQITTQQKVDVSIGQQVDVKPEGISKDQALEVKAITPETVKDIQQTSVLAKNETVFQSKEAVQIVGEAEKWLPPADEKLDVPEKFKDIENKY